MKIEILLFAAAKNAVGENKLVVELPDGSTVADLKKSLIDSGAELADLVPRSAFSVDQKYANDATKLEGSQEIAMIPPVSGG